MKLSLDSLSPQMPLKLEPERPDGMFYEIEHHLIDADTGKILFRSVDWDAWIAQAQIYTAAGCKLKYEGHCTGNFVPITKG